MQPFRGILTDETGGFSVDVEGSIAESQGEFEFPDSDAVMEAFMEGKTFILNPRRIRPHLDQARVGLDRWQGRVLEGRIRWGVSLQGFLGRALSLMRLAT